MSVSPLHCSMWRCLLFVVCCCLCSNVCGSDIKPSTCLLPVASCHYPPIHIIQSFSRSETIITKKRVMAKGKASQTKVVIKPEAFTAILLHAVHHKHDSVHGVLVGSSTKDTITVHKAVAVSHGAPTRPVVETALGLIQAKSDDTIVGWYTAPALLEDSKPGPVALRMAANLETDQVEPTLLVVQNAGLAACLKGEGKAEDAIEALGKDFGKQWLAPLDLTLESPTEALKSVKDSIAKGVKINDLLDHLDGQEFLPWTV